MAIRLNGLTKANCTRLGEGDERSVFLAMLYVGLGATMHTIPAVWQMIQDGYDVTVNCRDFQRPIWEAVGATVTTMREPLGADWWQNNKSKYGRIVTLSYWDVWECYDTGTHRAGTFDEIAEILGTELPKEFSFVDVFGCQTLAGKEHYILYAPNALETWRTLPILKADPLFEELQAICDTVRITGSECPDWQSLLSLIYNASVVVAVEGGVSNIAGALGVPVICLTGMVEAGSTIGQYRRYIPDLKFEEIKGYQPEGCSMPCYRQEDRGFINARCLGKYEIPQCLAEIDTAPISNIVSEFLNNYEHGDN